MQHHPLRRQPDQPLAICPCCHQPWPDEDGDVEKFLRKNTIKGVSKIRLAQILKWPLGRLERFAARCKPPIELAAATPLSAVEIEHQPRGA